MSDQTGTTGGTTMPRATVTKEHRKPTPAPKPGAKKAAAKKPAEAKEKEVRPFAYVTPGFALITVSTFAAGSTAKAAIEAALEAGKKAGSDKVACTNALHANGDVSATFGLVRTPAKNEKGALPLIQKVRDAMQESLRDSGYVVHR